MDKDTKISHIRAGGGVVFDPHGRILMIFRRNRWDLPKGHQERYETLRECAKREVCEECGLDPEQLEVHERAARTEHRSAPGELKHVTWFRMTYTGDPEKAKPQTEEGIERTEWFALPEARENVQKSYPSIRKIVDRL